MSGRRVRKTNVAHNPDGTITISWSDGSTSIVRDEVTHERILKALRGPGKYVHLREREPGREPD
jgi:hypothetical protein